jgi:hypothetical protein
MIFVFKKKNNKIKMEFNYNHYSKSDIIYSDYYNAIKGIINTSYDMVPYFQRFNIISSHLLLINKNEKGYYYIDVDINREGDIISHFMLENENKKNVKIELIVNNSAINFNNSFILILCCSQYTNFKLRFTFAEYPSELKYSYRIYLCQMKMRNALMASSLYSSGITYNDGYAIINK